MEIFFPYLSFQANGTQMYVMTKAKHKPITGCMQETQAAITSHTGSPHQDTDWIISMHKLVRC